MIRRLLRRWLDLQEPEDGLRETLAITIRCARRCAYDLAHAADMIPATDYRARFATLYADRATHWQGLFSSGASMKDYRLQLHIEIEQRDKLIAELRAELRKHGLPEHLPLEVPF